MSMEVRYDDGYMGTLSKWPLHGPIWAILLHFLLFSCRKRLLLNFSKGFFFYRTGCDWIVLCFGLTTIHFIGTIKAIERFC